MECVVSVGLLAVVMVSFALALNALLVSAHKMTHRGGASDIVRGLLDEGQVALQEGTFHPQYEKEIVRIQGEDGEHTRYFYNLEAQLVKRYDADSSDPRQARMGNLFRLEAVVWWRSGGPGQSRSGEGRMSLSADRLVYVSEGASWP